MLSHIKDNLKLNKRKIVVGGYCILSILMTLAFVLPTILASSYSVLSGDDFSHGVHIESFHEPFFRYLMASLSYMKKIYLTWQGTYFSMFLQAFLSPINNFGMPQLRMVMVVNSIATFGAILFLVWAVVSSSLKKDYLAGFLTVCVAMVYCITAYNPYVEVFYQFSCAVSYTYPFAFLLCALGLLIKYNVNGRKSLAVCSSVLGFFAVGGSLALAGVGNYACLLVCAFFITNDMKKMVKTNIIIFLFWLSGAIINAVAPGNYVRHAYIDSSGVHPISAFKTAFVGYGKRLNFFISETNFILVILVLVLFGIIITKSQTLEIKRYLIVSILFLFAPAIAAFPLSLGYSNFIYASFPDRVVFIMDTSLIFAYVNLAVCVGILIGNRLRDVEMRHGYIYMTLLLMLVDIGADGFYVNDLVFLQTSKRLYDGIYRNYYEKCVSFYDYLGTFEGGDVIIAGNQFPQTIDNFMCLQLSDDPTDYVNVSVSKYYGFDSLMVCKEE